MFGRFFSSQEPVLGKKKSLSEHLQPSGKMPLGWLKVTKTFLFHLTNAWICSLQLRCPPNSRFGVVNLLSLSSCNSFYRDPAVYTPAQRCSSMLRATLPYPNLKLSFPRLELRHHKKAHPPTLSLGG